MKNDTAGPKIIKVLIGQVALTHSPNILQSVLGSCIGAVIYDHSVKLAGMAHILLPDSTGKKGGALVGKYADQAIPCLYDALIKHGATTGKIKAKIAGGARMFTKAMEYQKNDVGTKNIEAVKVALKKIGVPVVANDLGGLAGRKVEFDINTLEYKIEDFSRNRRVI